MPTPTTRLRARLIDSGSELNTWGGNLNNQVFSLFDEAIAGVEKITLSGSTYTLTSANYVSDQARNAALIFQGSPSAAVAVTIPAVEKTYVVVNDTAQGITLGCGGTTAALAAGDRAVVWCDGTNCGLGSISAATVNGLILAASLSPGTLPGQAGNSGKFLQTNGTAPVWATVPDPYPTIAGNALKFLRVNSGAAAVEWAAPNEILREARTSNTVLGIADRGKLIDITSGTFTQTFAAAATLGSGWYCYIRNAGSGDITLDPNASETIDGLTSFIMYPSEMRLIQCDGSALRSVVLSTFYRSFTSSGTWTKPPGYSRFGGLLWGGGGGGGRSGSASWYGGGGGGGACVPFDISAASLAASVSVTIGAGGSLQSGVGAGGVGGSSSFGTVTAYGGGGGGGNGAAHWVGGGGGGALGAGTSGAGVTAADGAGGLPVYQTASGTNPIAGGAGFGGGSGHFLPQTKPAAYGGGGGGMYVGAENSSQTNLGGNALYGGGGGGSYTTGGTSTFGGNGGAGSAGASSGSTGSVPGGGGGGSQTGSWSGAGAAGELRIWGIC